MKKFFSYLLTIILTFAFFFTGAEYIIKIPSNVAEKKESGEETTSAQDIRSAPSTLPESTTAAETAAGVTVESRIQPADVSVTETDEITQAVTVTETESETETEAPETSRKTLFGGVGRNKFRAAPEGYFNDALFVGDSRTEALSMYGNIPSADYYAKVGMSVYNIYSDPAKVEGKGKIRFSEFINQKKYGKVYVMLGLNELGYDRKRTVSKYSALIEDIKKAQPEAIIYIEALLHVTAAEEKKNIAVTNAGINDFNSKIAKICDDETTFYLDVNDVLDNAFGYLKDDSTNDGVHLKAKYVRQWANAIQERAVVL
ncbi:MAG: hypothetical protein K6B52_08300 [Clostridiales bacterium]|nr:hypothetical protein [Clostridiales bacterium]